MVIDFIFKMVDYKKSTILCGDFNICFKQERKNSIISSLERHGFEQLVKESTHIVLQFDNECYCLVLKFKVEYGSAKFSLEVEFQSKSVKILFDVDHC